MISTLTLAGKLKFNAKINRMGKNKIIWIPKGLHKDIEGYENEQLTITIERTKDLK